MEQTIDGHLSACIQYANSIGGTTYYNICDGTTHWVPWGSADWFGAIFIGVLLVLVAGVIGFIWRMTR